jgi:hypothetical protein
MAGGVPALQNFRAGGRGPQRVAIFAAEDSELSMRTRLRALCKARGLDPAVACANIHLQCRGHLDLLNDQDFCSLVAAARMLGPLGAVALDPLRDLHGAEENDSTAMAAVMGRLRALRDLLGCTVIFVHHMAKSTKDNVDRRPGQRLRGSGGMHGAIDVGLYLSLTEATDSSWTNTVVSEVKAGRGAGMFTLRLDVADDDNGEALTARWTFSEKTTLTNEEKQQAKLEESTARLIQLLRVEWRKNPAAPMPQSSEALCRGLQGHKSDMREVINAAEAQGRAKRLTKGNKALGVVYLPEPGETP